jgi:hypothetical protein
VLTEVVPGRGGEGTGFDLGRDEHSVVFASVISRGHRDAVVIGAGALGAVGEEDSLLFSFVPIHISKLHPSSRAH